MSYQCKVCGNNTIFFVWSSTRGFPREKLIELVGKKQSKRWKKGILNGTIGVPVCFKCAAKLGYGKV